MSEITITCPSCGQVFPLSDALMTQLHAHFDREHEERLRAAVREAEARAAAQLAPQLATLQKLLEEQSEKARAAEAREIELRQRALALEQEQAQAIGKARVELEERLRKESEERLRALVAETEKRVRAADALEREQLQARLDEQAARLAQAQQAELELRKKAEDLEARSRELDLELARRLDAKKSEWEASLRQLLAAEQDLKLKEKEKQIEDMKRVIDDLKRKSEQGSQERQGEVLELDIETALAQHFPLDQIAPVKKGARGADVIHTVRNDALEVCGRIVWEAKNARNWSNGWLAKLKDDRQEAGAALAVLVTTALPEGVRGFGCVEGVWVSDRASYLALAAALRAQLIEVARAQAVASGVSTKMELLYQYLTGPEFRSRIETIVATFNALREQLERERRAMLKQWAEREKLIERVVTSTTTMHGALAGIVGGALPAIPALEFDEAKSPEEEG
jgi:hypothetical protein